MATVEHPTTLVSLTPVAAEKIKSLLAEEADGEVSVLRVAIQGGGCSGFQYGLGFDAGPVEGDEVVEQHGVTVVVGDEIVAFPEIDYDDFPNGFPDAPGIQIIAASDADALDLVRRLRGS